MIMIIKVTADIIKLLLCSRHCELHVHCLTTFSLLSNVDHIFNPVFIEEETEA